MRLAVTRLYRSVSLAEYGQIAETHTFELGKAAEGKYFWESERDARRFASRIGDPHVVAAVFVAEIAAMFDFIPSADAIGPARFAPEGIMNLGLLEMTKI
jgi:hypothetical protein